MRWGGVQPFAALTELIIFGISLLYIFMVSSLMYCKLNHMFNGNLFGRHYIHWIWRKCYFNLYWLRYDIATFVVSYSGMWDQNIQYVAIKIYISCLSNERFLHTFCTPRLIWTPAITFKCDWIAVHNWCRNDWKRKYGRRSMYSFQRRAPLRWA